METQATKKQMLRNIPPRLKGKIARRVEQTGTNMNDVLVAILADHFNVEFTPSGVRRLSVGPSPQVLLTVPVQLKTMIEDVAHERRDTENNVMLEIISRAFGVAFRPTGRWPKRETASA